MGPALQVAIEEKLSYNLYRLLQLLLGGGGGGKGGGRNFEVKVWSRGLKKRLWRKIVAFGWRCGHGIYGGEFYK